jgi:hypothetical protein
MSGPIVRKYGFPNFDKIFGERPLEHGADEEQEASVEQPEEASSAESTKQTSAKKNSSKPKKA